MVDIARALANQGMPEGDLYSLPSSPATFPDGAHFRVELSGIETLKVLEATVNEAQKLGVPFHRAISVARGATVLTREELSAFARLAHDAKVEVIMTPGPRPGWDIGCQAATPEGAISGFRLRGMDSVRHYIMDIQRCLDLGFRGFLVWDEGVLSLLNGMKENGDLPPDIIFKMSVLAGHANPAGVRLVESLGAASCNPVADLTLPMLAGIRHVTALPLDIHIQIWSSMGGFNRFYEAPEIARVAAPCYFKMEPGPGFAMYLPWGDSEDSLARLGREKIRWIKNIIEITGETHPGLKVSAPGVADLKIPLP